LSRQKRQVAEELITEVRRSQLATDRFDQAVADALGLNRTDMRCIDVLEREGSQTAGQLAEATGLTSGAMTTALDRLERLGYARRVRDSTDRRRVLVEITDEAHNAAGELFGEIASGGGRLLDRYTAGELELLLKFERGMRELNEQQAVRLEQENRARQTRSSTA